MKTTRRTLTKSGNYTDAYIPGETLRMKWGREWIINTVMYSEATNVTYINLVKMDNDINNAVADQAQRIADLRISSLIRYSDEAYERKELALSNKAKEDLLYYVREHEKLFKTKCTHIIVLGKWPEPWPRRDSRTMYATWRIHCTFDDKTGKEIHINRKATY